MKIYTKKRRGHFIFSSEELKKVAKQEAERRGMTLSQFINKAIQNELS